MTRIYEFRNKEVINISTGQRLGFITDVNLNPENGKISSVVIPQCSRLFGMFGKETEYVIPWENIRKIGKDIVLVDHAVLSKDNKH